TATASCPAARWVVPFTRPARNRTWAAFSVALMTAICSYISSSSSPVTVSPVIVFGSVIIGSVTCTAPRRRVQVRLRLPQRVERAADGPVLATGDEQLLGGELGDDFAAIRGDHDLLLD